MEPIDLRALSHLDALFDASISITIGSSDAQRRPHFLRAMGLRVGEEPRHLEVLVARGVSDQLLADVQVNPQLACAVVNVDNYEARQFVGVFESTSDAQEADLLRAERTQRKAAESFRRYFGDGAAEGFMNYVTRPALLLRIRVDAVFHQTPGPQAGMRLA